MCISTSHVSGHLWRALLSLEGLSVGDAFGERFFTFTPLKYHRYFEKRVLPEQEQGTWKYTDDTQMALSVVETLRRAGAIDQDRLIESFITHYEPGRGYGANMHTLLLSLGTGKASWRELTPAQFEGAGSYGNGAAMRVAPLGAFFADDLEQVVAQARLSAEVTHSHPEAIAGAIAVAVAAALAWQAREVRKRPERAAFLARVLTYVPASEVHSKLLRACDIAPQTSAQAVAAILGSGYQISAQDTVPYTLWCASEFLDDYTEALWQTASGLGDVDTTCAIVGGIVALYAGVENIPEAWLEGREELPRWAIEDEN